MNSAVKKMEDEATRNGYKALIASMNKLTAGKNEKVAAKAKAKAKSAEKKPDKKVKDGKAESPEVTDELRDIVKGFFNPKKPEAKERADLYVGSKGRKKKAKAPEVKKKQRRRPGAPKGN